MMCRLLAHRGLICLAPSAVGGTVGVSEWPFPADDPVLAVIHDVQPTVYAVFLYDYITLWFTSTWLLLYVGTSLLTIFVAPATDDVSRQPLPPYPAPATRRALCLPRRAASPAHASAQLGTRWRAMTAKTFLAWVRQGLVPRLWPGAIVVLDNLAAHKLR